MRIEHIALYVNDLESARRFFVKTLEQHLTMAIITLKRIFARTSFPSIKTHDLKS